MGESVSGQEEKTAQDLSELKAALEQSEEQAKLVKEQLEATIAEQKEEAAKELNEVKVALEQSQEQAKVSLAQPFDQTELNKYSIRIIKPFTY